MYRFLHLATLSLVSIQSLVLAAPLTTPRYFQKHPITRRDLSPLTVQQELGPLLSNGTTIFGPDDPRFDEATKRYNINSRPVVEVVVVPAKESDVSIIVKYCDENSIEFLAHNRGHGLTTSIRSFKGLEIHLENLVELTIAKDGKSVKVGGGLSNGDVAQTLWPKGYVTTTGTQACVGVMGAGLGGGHGIHEGQYGLVTDNFIHMNVVLANGTAIGVNATSNKDLWWAMRGAGHNFGIVTSATMKLYPKKTNSWHYHTYTWSGDKLEAVLEAANAFHTSYKGTTPPLMGFSAGQYAVNPAVSETEVSLYWTFGYSGPAAEAERLLAGFNAIEAVNETMGETTWPGLGDAITPGGEAQGCIPQRITLSSTIRGNYNITAQRQILDLYNRMITEYPELASSEIYNEGYATKGVEDVPADSTAYPHRHGKHVIFMMVRLAEGSTLQGVADEWVKATWDLWLEGSGPNAKPTTYVNYAIGADWETQQSTYGYEPWRLAKLRDLKTKYDPDNKFNHFVPIIVS